MRARGSTARAGDGGRRQRGQSAAGPGGGRPNEAQLIKRLTARTVFIIVLSPPTAPWLVGGDKTVRLYQPSGPVIHYWHSEGLRASSFEHEHVDHEHNMWDFLYFVMHLNHKAEIKIEYNGAETFVANCIAEEELVLG